MQRRLAVILVADIVGYSRLIEHDETGSIECLQSDRKALIDPKFAAHGGKITKRVFQNEVQEARTLMLLVQELTQAAKTSAIATPFATLQ